MRNAHISRPQCNFPVGLIRLWLLPCVWPRLWTHFWEAPNLTANRISNLPLLMLPPLNAKQSSELSSDSGHWFHLPSNRAQGFQLFQVCTSLRLSHHTVAHITVAGKTELLPIERAETEKETANWISGIWLHKWTKLCIYSLIHSSIFHTTYPVQGRGTRIYEREKRRKMFFFIIFRQTEGFKVIWGTFLQSSEYPPIILSNQLIFLPDEATSTLLERSHLNCQRTRFLCFINHRILFLCR